MMGSSHVSHFPRHVSEGIDLHIQTLPKGQPLPGNRYLSGCMVSPLQGFKVERV
jgi:hypothetical protein